MSTFLVILLISLCKLCFVLCAFDSVPSQQGLSTDSRVAREDSNVDDKKHNSLQLQQPITITANRYKENYNPSDDFLDEPISSINIDYMNNAVILQFRHPMAFDDDFGTEIKRRAAIDKNFMRFGRGSGGNSERSMMRFGKRQVELVKNENPLIGLGSEERPGRVSSSIGTGSRNLRGDNFMRFGRGNNEKSLMRFGRAAQSGDRSMMRFGRSNDRSKMRFGRASGDRSKMRFGRSSGDRSKMRFGRSNDKSMMRFGRSNMATLDDENSFRFTRSELSSKRPTNSGSFMRFGRSLMPSSQPVVDYDMITPYEMPIIGGDFRLQEFRDDNGFQRSGKLDRNFMRFGKRSFSGNDQLLIPSNENSNNEETLNENNFTKILDDKFNNNYRDLKSSLSKATKLEDNLDMGETNLISGDNYEQHPWENNKSELNEILYLRKRRR